MYKCLDGQRRVTYSNITCDKQGLSDAGPVAERVTSMPFVAPPKPKPAAPAMTTPAPPPAKSDAEAGGSAAQVKPVVPLLEKLAK